MKDAIVKDLMVPLSEYATVSEGSTLFDAVLALEKAQEEFDYKHTQYLHRAVLILNKNKRVIGKLSQFDVLKALERKNEKTERIDDISKFGFSDQFLTSLKKRYLMSLILKPQKNKVNVLPDMCSNLAQERVVFRQTAENLHIPI